MTHTKERKLDEMTVDALTLRDQGLSDHRIAAELKTNIKWVRRAMKEIDNDQT